MSVPIVPTNLNIPAIAPTAAFEPPGTGGAAFQSVFMEAVAKLEGFQQNAGARVNRFLNGEGEELHDVALKTQAELTFEMFMQVRNRIVAAYQEVMGMQV